ncbi:MAG: MerR family transcriptional regulator [Kibdelosporangium sp.]
MTANTLGIGDLARATGVPVRTIRFYCDSGVLEAVRSTGGHRRFPLGTVDQLKLIRRLRGLGLGLPSIVEVLSGAQSLDEAVAAERKALDIEVAALAWRRASLRAIEEASPADRAARLDLLSAVQNGPAAREALMDFWRRLFLAPLPEDTVGMFLEVSVPALSADPTPTEVVAYAEMVTLLEDPVLRRQMLARTRFNTTQIADEAALHAGVGEACLIALPLVAAGQSPAPGPALDHFVTTHAQARGEHDTPTFRRELLTLSALDRTPRFRRYWHLVGTVTGEPVTVGETHTWLLDSLSADVQLSTAKFEG